MTTPIKSAALRKAQINLLPQKVTIEDSQIRELNVKVALSAIPALEQTQNFTHPFYWAGFTVIGNPW